MTTSPACYTAPTPSDENTLHQCYKHMTTKGQYNIKPQHGRNSTPGDVKVGTHVAIEWSGYEGRVIKFGTVLAIYRSHHDCGSYVVADIDFDDDTGTMDMCMDNLSNSAPILALLAKAKAEVHDIWSHQIEVRANHNKELSRECEPITEKPTCARPDCNRKLTRLDIEGSISELGCDEAKAICGTCYETHYC